MRHTLATILISVLAIGCSQRDPHGASGSRPTGNGQSIGAIEDSRPKRADRPVVPEDLTALLRQADRIVVTEGPFDDAKRLFESSDRADVNELMTALDVKKPQDSFFCMCSGTPAIYIYKGDELLAEVTNHHADSIRCSLWDSDAPITDRENWLAWFDARQITGPRLEFEQMQAQREQRRKDWDKWMAAMPPGLDKAWGGSQRAFDQVDTSGLRTALDVSISDKREQIRALLTWFGSGAGPWSGFPSYESAAEDVLLEYDIADVVSAIEIDQMSPQQLEGAARLFGGWTFSQRHPNGLQEVPDALKAALWNHVKDTKDKDKLSRAMTAFQ